MNNPKYDGVLYPVRHITDLKDLVISSTDMFKDKTAYLVKDRPGGSFQPITYGQVREDMEALGTRLVDLGLKGKKIAVIGESSYSWILTYFATVCGVGAIVPLDKNLPPEELKSLIKRSGASALVFSKKSEKNIKELFDEPYDLEYFISMAATSHDDKVLSFNKLIEEGNNLLKNGIRDFIDAEIDPNQMSTLMFTSGTTGMAKGVMLSHLNIAANVENMSKLVGLEEGMVILSILPIHHAYEMSCVIWTTFFQGKTIAICEGIRYIQKNMVEVGAGCMVGVPLVFEKMYKGMWKQAKSRGETEKLRKAIDLSRKMKLYNNPRLMRKLFKAVHQNFGNNMKLFIAGGAAIDPKVIEDFEAMGLPMIQGYGMSENAPIIAVNQDRFSVPASVGRPMPGTEVRIEDPDENGVGEIVCKGPSVMLGYYDNPEATAEVLRDGWLYTGDLGYLDENGFLYVTGRKKTVIVTKGGKNIFPEELEAVLLENELIQETLVHGVTDKHVGNVIVTADIFPNYPLLKKLHGEMNSGEIYNFYRELVDEVNETLPPYKIIKRVNIREKDFEKTTTGKIKRYGNFTEGADAIKSDPENQAARSAQKKQAEKFVERIKKDADESTVTTEMRPITDIRNILTGSCDKHGEKIAFIEYGGAIAEKKEVFTATYKQVLADVNCLGTALINRDYKDTNIGLYGNMSYHYCTAYLAIASGLGSAVPISMTFSDERIAEVIKESNMASIFVETKYWHRLSSILDRYEIELDEVFILDKDIEEIDTWKSLIKEGHGQIAKGDRQFLDCEVSADDIVHIQYDDEKGLGRMLSNMNIAQTLMAVESMIGVLDGDVVSPELPEAKGSKTILGMLLPLYTGAAVTLMSGDRQLINTFDIVDPTIIIGTNSIVEALHQCALKEIESQGNVGRFRRLSAINNTTSKFGLNILKSFVSKSVNLAAENLRLIFVVDEFVDDEALDFFNSIGVKVIQGYSYGQCASVIAINNTLESGERNDSVGKLIPGMTATLSKEDQIYLAGNNIMAGYYGDDMATEEAFDEGWLKSGLQGCIDSEGYIYLKK